MTHSGADARLYLKPFYQKYLMAENADIQAKVKAAREAGAHITTCKGCADQLEVTETLEGLGIEVMYWGVPLTDLLKNDETLITI